MVRLKCHSEIIDGKVGLKVGKKWEKWWEKSGKKVGKMNGKGGELWRVKSNPMTTPKSHWMT